jgi:hypothetical protein
MTNHFWEAFRTESKNPQNPFIRISHNPSNFYFFSVPKICGKGGWREGDSDNSPILTQNFCHKNDKFNRNNWKLCRNYANSEKCCQLAGAIIGRPASIHRRLLCQTSFPPHSAAILIAPLQIGKCYFCKFYAFRF